MADDKPKRNHGFTGMAGGPLGFVYTSPWWLLIMVIGWMYIIYLVEYHYWLLFCCFLHR